MKNKCYLRVINGFWEKVQIGRLGREHRRLSINTHIDRLKVIQMTKLSTKRLRIRAILFTPPNIVLPRSRSVLLEGLADDETSHLGFMTLTMTVTHIRNC